MTTVLFMSEKLKVRQRMAEGVKTELEVTKGQVRERWRADLQ